MQHNAFDDRSTLVQNGLVSSGDKLLPKPISMSPYALRWRRNGRGGISNHQAHDCLFNRFFRCRSKKTSKLRVTGLWAGIHRVPVNSPHKWPVTRKMFSFDGVIMGYIPGHSQQSHIWTVWTNNLDNNLAGVGGAVRFLVVGTIG